MPAAMMASVTSPSPFGNRELAGCHSPTVSHHPGSSEYQPASITKYSAPAAAAASTSGSSFAVVGSPIRQFM